MGAFLDKPKTDKESNSGFNSEFSYGLSSMQGWRIEMEDAHCAHLKVGDVFEDWSFFGVFDGHAGANVSAICAQKLLHCIINSDELSSYGADNKIDPTDTKTLKQAIVSGFLKLDDDIRNMAEVVDGDDKSGSTASCALISPTHIYLINCGDSRVVLCRDGEPAVWTEDHKPINPIEKQRIEKAGGTVMIQRVNGSLAVSRAVGDFEYKMVPGCAPTEQLVSPEPEIYVEPRSDNDEFLILACDGVWDVFNNSEICQYVRSRMQLTDDLAKLCSDLLDTCLHKGSRDNMTVEVVRFKAAPKVCEERVKQEEQLERMIEEKMKKLVANSSAEDISDSSYYMQQLAVECIEHLPPGGLAAKQQFVEDLLDKWRIEKGGTSLANREMESSDSTDSGSGDDGK